MLGLGDSATRRRVGGALDDTVDWADALVHPLASIGSVVQLGVGTVVTAGARLTTGIVVGRHGYVGPNATIGHDAVLEDYVTVLPGATVSGNVHPGCGSVRRDGGQRPPGIRVGEGAVIGAGAVVLTDVARRHHRGGRSGAPPALRLRSWRRLGGEGHRLAVEVEHRPRG